MLLLQSRSDFRRQHFWHHCRGQSWKFSLGLNDIELLILKVHQTSEPSKIALAPGDSSEVITPGNSSVAVPLATPGSSWETRSSVLVFDGEQGPDTLILHSIHLATPHLKTPLEGILLTERSPCRRERPGISSWACCMKSCISLLAHSFISLYL